MSRCVPRLVIKLKTLRFCFTVINIDTRLKLLLQCRRRSSFKLQRTPEATIAKVTLVAISFSLSGASCVRSLAHR
jgi:hypothetical protein